MARTFDPQGGMTLMLKRNEAIRRIRQAIEDAQIHGLHTLIVRMSPNVGASVGMEEGVYQHDDTPFVVEYHTPEPL